MTGASPGLQGIAGTAPPMDDDGYNAGNIRTCGYTYTETSETSSVDFFTQERGKR